MITSVETTARTLLNQLEDGWNTASGEAFAAPFTENADFVDIRGQHHQGRDVIAAGHQEIFDTIYTGSQVAYHLRQARALAEDVLLAQATATLDAPTGSHAGARDTVATLVLVRKDGEWQIASYHNTLVEPAR